VLFALAPATMQVVAVVGAITAIVAASIGLVQNDIKKVLAYSTVSQLGYMFLALGMGAFAAGLFHVVTHAFFKALLFLGAGSVIHALHEEQDIRNMGGLKAHLPATYRTFLVATLAIAGIPPLAGFVSKDEILWKTFSHGSWFLWLIGLVGAAFTAFYMTRLLVLTFEGKGRWEGHKHPHESPATMTVPLIVLAVLSAVGGLLGWPASLGGSNPIDHFLEPVFARANDIMALPGHGHDPVEYLLMVLSVAVAAGAMVVGWRWYTARPEIPENLSRRFAGVYRLLLNKYWVDEVYDAAVVNPLMKGSDAVLWKGVDVGVIDWTVNALARLVGAVSGTVRTLQSGVVQSYALVFLAGVVAILGWLLLRT
jgi:NADH-quinone oxidoreductase subunit L